MEKHEFLELFNAANKAAKSVKGDKFSPPVLRFKDVVKLLMQVPESVVCSGVILINVVGDSLNYFRNHRNPHIQSEGNVLCDHFMKILYAQGRKPNPVKTLSTSMHKTEESKQNMVKTKVHKTGDMVKIKMHKTRDSKRDMVKIKKHKNGDTVKTKKQKTHVDSKRDMVKTSMDQSVDTKRDKVREILKTALAKVANEVIETEMKKRVLACDPSSVAVSIESAMFEKLGSFMGPEKAKYRSIMFNMDDSNNPDLRRKVLVGEIDGERLVTMKKEEMASEKIQEEVQRLNEKARFKAENQIKIVQSEDKIMSYD